MILGKKILLQAESFASQMVYNILRSRDQCNNLCQEREVSLICTSKATAEK